MLKTIFKAIFIAIIAFFALLGSGIMSSFIKFYFSKEGQAISNDENLCDSCISKKLAKKYFIHLADNVDI